MKKKAKAEDEYFRSCQREAAAAAAAAVAQKNEPKNGGRNGNNKLQQEVAALFGKQGAQGINFAKYNDIKVEVKTGETAVATTAASGGGGKRSDNTVFTDYDELQLIPQLKRNIKSMNYTKSTPIQRHAIPLGIIGHDLMCCAQTGSGKTCAFLLPVVVSLAGKQKNQNQQQQKKKQKQNNQRPQTQTHPAKTNNEPVSPKCVVLAPTRELASQIELEAKKLCFNLSNICPVAVYGGASQNKQLRELAFASINSQKNDDDDEGTGGGVIVVATPGRLTDFVDRNIISLFDVKFLILDEADRMLDMGFEPQIRQLVLRSNMSPKSNRQTFMFSATFPNKIQKLAGEFLRPNYTWIAVGRVGSTTDSIQQVIIEASADKRRKLKLVVESIENGPPGRTLIFVQKKRSATWLKKQLSKGGPEGWDYTFKPIQAEDIHGDRSQSQRETALAKFRSGECRILVATDVAARGLDIQGVEHVINVDLPTAADDFDSYVHRIGRTGRAGHTGLATSFYVLGDPPSGNRKIAGLLIKQLMESKVEIPNFLTKDCANCVGPGGTSSGNKRPQSDVRNHNNRNNSGPNGRGGRSGRGRGNGRGRGGRGGGRGGPK